MTFTTRFRLRDATDGQHRRLDEAFGALDLTRRDDYRRFLQAHARVVPALEAMVADGTPWSGFEPGSPALLDDLARLGSEPPPPMAYPGPGGEPATWGLQYVLEGSRLGAKLLIEQVGSGFPRRYLAARSGLTEWRQFQTELEAACVEGGDEAWSETAARAARAAFAMFERAAAVEAGMPA